MKPVLIKNLIPAAFLFVFCIDPPAIWAAIIRVPQDYLTIQEALDSAKQGDTIAVEPGEYHETLRWPEVDSIVLDGTSANPEDTWINADYSGSVISSHHVNRIKISIRGFGLRYGSSSSTGGGLDVSNADLDISLCVIADNAAIFEGGGGYLSQCVVTVEDSVIQNNTAGNGVYRGDGAGLYLDGCSSYFHNTTVRHHSPYYAAGAGIHTLGSTVFERCFFADNAILGTGMEGSAILGRGQYLQISHCVFQDNRGSLSVVVCRSNDFNLYNNLLLNNTGATIDVEKGTGRIEFCSFIDNEGGLRFQGSDLDVVFLNNIFFGNEFGAMRDSGIVINNYNCYFLNTMNLSGLNPGRNEIFTDPLFVSSGDNLFLLSQMDSGQSIDSPCVDSGDPSADIPNGTTRTDSLPDTGRADIGYHYFGFNPPSPTPTPVPSFTPEQTPTPIPERRLDISTNQMVYFPEDRMILTLTIDNPMAQITANLYIVLEIFNNFYFWPDWCAYPDCIDYRETTTQQHSRKTMEILNFLWPEIDLELYSTCYGALIEPGSNRLLLMDSCSFQYQQ